LYNGSGTITYLQAPAKIPIRQLLSLSAVPLGLAVEDEEAFDGTILSRSVKKLLKPFGKKVRNHFVEDSVMTVASQIFDQS
jgi:hypothetical protein